MPDTAQTPTDVKAALYEVLKALPGATLVPAAKDPEGRGGVGVEFDAPTPTDRTLTRKVA